jgi:hypothetical protein
MPQTQPSVYSPRSTPAQCLAIRPAGWWRRRGFRQNTSTFFWKLGVSGAGRRSFCVCPSTWHPPEHLDEGRHDCVTFHLYEWHAPGRREGQPGVTANEEPGVRPWHCHSLAFPGRTSGYRRWVVRGVGYQRLVLGADEFGAPRHIGVGVQKTPNVEDGENGFDRAILRDLLYIVWTGLRPICG